MAPVPPMPHHFPEPPLWSGGGCCGHQSANDIISAHTSTSRPYSCGMLLRYKLLTKFSIDHDWQLLAGSLSKKTPPLLRPPILSCNSPTPVKPQLSSRAIRTFPPLPPPHATPLCPIPSHTFCSAPPPPPPHSLSPSVNASQPQPNQTGSASCPLPLRMSPHRSPSLFIPPSLSAALLTSYSSTCSLLSAVLFYFGPHFSPRDTKVL